MSEGLHAILVFGCAAHADGRPRPALLRRLERALVEAQADPDAPVVVSGGAVEGPCEAEVMARWLSAAGIDEARLVREPEARDTLANAQRCAHLAQQLGVARITLVTERWHARRSGYLLRRALERLGASPTVSAASAEGGESLWRSLVEALKLVIDGLRQVSRP